MTSYAMVCQGLDLFEEMNVDNYENIVPSIQEYKTLVDEKDKTVAVNHTEFLVWLKNKNTET